MVHFETIIFAHNWVSIHGRDTNISVCHCVKTGCELRIVLYRVYWEPTVFFPGVNLSVRIADYLPTSSADCE